MAYVQFTIPNTGVRKFIRMQILGAMDAWMKIHDVFFEKDIAGYEINYHFANPQDLSFFCLNPPDLPQNYKIVN